VSVAAVMGVIVGVVVFLLKKKRSGYKPIKWQHKIAKKKTNNNPIASAICTIRIHLMSQEKKEKKKKRGLFFLSSKYKLRIFQS
jgi:hypothetical protein